MTPEQKRKLKKETELVILEALNNYIEKCEVEDIRGPFFSRRHHIAEDGGRGKLDRFLGVTIE